ncbi:hypothetical protein HK104_010114 [Borealophlyctis nickersoniae]|nr:hypothetical protein HK104_010114 [Borealophlyctis nickersoniae]
MVKVEHKHEIMIDLTEDDAMKVESVDQEETGAIGPTTDETDIYLDEEATLKDEEETVATVPTPDETVIKAKLKVEKINGRDTIVIDLEQKDAEHKDKEQKNEQQARTRGGKRAKGKGSGGQKKKRKGSGGQKKEEEG